MKGKIAGIIATLFVAFAILSVSVLRTATPRYAYSPAVLAEKTVDSKSLTVDYLLAYQGKINPDNPLWYAKVVRDKVWYALTFNKSKKLELNLLFADKRLNSSLELFKNNKPDIGLSTLTKAEKYLEKAVPTDSKDSEYLKKLALASLKHREVIEKEILPITPEDLRPEAIKSGNLSREIYQKVKEQMISIGAVPPQDIFGLK